ncbi:MAG TPA: hypothetical protein VIL74_21480 [Pyrinomonadaceae bacterium]|jgi:hypothetical protein
MQKYSIGTEMKFVVGAIVASILMFITFLFIAWYMDDIRPKPFSESSYPASRSY